MINEIRRVFRDVIIDQQSWLKMDVDEANQEGAEDPAQKCKDRANDIGDKIGFPAFLTDERQLKTIDALYSDLSIEPSDVFIANIIKIARHEVILEVAKLLSPVDHDREWLIQPLIVNAFYETVNNNISMDHET